MTSQTSRLMRRCPHCSAIVAMGALLRVEGQEPRCWFRCPRCGAIGRLRDYARVRAPQSRYCEIERAVLTR